VFDPERLNATTGRYVVCCGGVGGREQHALQPILHFCGPQVQLSKHQEQQNATACMCMSIIVAVARVGSFFRETHGAIGIHVSHRKGQRLNLEQVLQSKLQIKV
jgi:hypothetical protein